MKTRFLKLASLVSECSTLGFCVATSQEPPAAPATSGIQSNEPEKLPADADKNQLHDLTQPDSTR